MATGAIDKLWVQTINALLLVVGMMITLFCVNLVAVSWVVINFSKGPSSSNSQEAQKRPVRIVFNIGHGILLLS